ncbi:hypothetical protein DL93DRAFT_2093880 [Clavulina sp. PMI_390]|nr:hypothetical protein DL93DRAFT_2093880 [Clavulina sp. PMI_390]
MAATLSPSLTRISNQGAITIQDHQNNQRPQFQTSPSSSPPTMSNMMLANNGTRLVPPPHRSNPINTFTSALGLAEQHQPRPMDSRLVAATVTPANVMASSAATASTESLLDGCELRPTMSSGSDTSTQEDGRFRAFMRQVFPDKLIYAANNPRILPVIHH